MGVDHVGTMQQWEERMATSMWRVSCVFLLLLLALPTTKARILCLTISLVPIFFWLWLVIRFFYFLIFWKLPNLATYSYK
jgi:uncharacterized membrane protein